MNHAYAVSGKKQPQKDRDRKLQNISRCVLIVLAISITILTMTGLGPAHAQPNVQTLCPMFIMKLPVSTSKPVYSVGEEIIVTWKPAGSSGTGQLTLKGPSGTYQYSLGQTQMSQGSYDAGTAQPGDVGSWSAYLQYNPQPGCQPNIYGSTTFQVMSGTSPGSGCGFILSVAPVSQTVVQGGTADFGLSATPTNPTCIPSFASMNIAVAGLGPGMNYEFMASSIAITTSPTTPPGVYAISLLMVSANGAAQQTQMTVIVTQATTTATTVVSTSTAVPFGFSITVSPASQSVPLGGTTSFVVSVLAVAGSPVPVSLAVMGLPSDVRSSFTTQSGMPPYTSTLNLDLSNSAANPGAYTLTVEGTAAGSLESATATLMIQPAQTTTTTTASGGVIIALGIIIVLVALVVVLGALVMRSRGRRTPTQQATAPQQAMAPSTFCGKCGTENSASNEFCTRCGNKLKTS